MTITLRSGLGTNVRSLFRAVLLAGACLFSGTSCELKGPAFFKPETTAPVLVDDTPVIFNNFQPQFGSTFGYHINSATFDVADPPGSNGVTPSGVDPATVRATYGSLTPTLGASGLRYTIPLTGISDGLLDWRLNASDKKGNAGSAQWGFTLDNTAPNINVTTIPPTGSSNAAQVTFNYAGTITDAFPGSYTAGLYKVGASGLCGNADNTLWPKGTSAGRVSENTWTLTPSFNISLNAFNGVSFGSPAVTAKYCWQVRAEDGAKDATGAANPNVATRFLSFDYTWDPMAATTGAIIGHVTSTLNGVTTPVVGAVLTASTRTATTDAGGAYRVDLLPPGGTSIAVSNTGTSTCVPASKTVTVVAGSDVTADFGCTGTATTTNISWILQYIHSSGFSTTCGTAMSNPALPNAPYTGFVTGPMGGVMGSGTFSGTTNASGVTPVIKQTIVLFGTYRYSIVFSGVTYVSPDLIVNSTPGTGTCTPAP